MPAVFMIPGGGFYGISPLDSLQMTPDIPSTVTFGGKLVDSLNVNVYVIFYETTPDSLLQHLVPPYNVSNSLNCSALENETAKDHVIVKLNNSNTQKTTGVYPLTLVDTRGIAHQNTTISDGRAEINVSRLEPGTYKVVIQAGGEVVFATLSIFR